LFFFNNLQGGLPLGKPFCVCDGSSAMNRRRKKKLIFLKNNKTTTTGGKENSAGYNRVIITLSGFLII
jgi:hypothetical protein